MPSPVFDPLNLISDDLDATVRRYQRLGLQPGDPFRTLAGEPAYASNKSGEGALLEADSPAFARVWSEGWKGDANLNGRIVVGLKVAGRAMGLMSPADDAHRATSPF